MRTLIIGLILALAGVAAGLGLSRMDRVASIMDDQFPPAGSYLSIAELPANGEHFSEEQLTALGFRTCFRRNTEYPDNLPEGTSWLEPREERGRGGETATPPRPTPDLETLPGLVKLSRISRDSVRGTIRFHCGATRISENWFLTAAHCIKSEEEAFDIVIYPARADSQEAGLAVQPASHVMCHSASDFFVRSNRFGDDIALVYVPETDGFEDVSVATVDAARGAARPADIRSTYFAGWSQNSETSEMTDAGLVIENGARFLQGGPLQPSIVGRQIIRTEAVDEFGPCQGDSGGPLYLETENGPKVIGLLSSIIPPEPTYGEDGRRTNDDCRPQTTSFYVRPSGYTDWIRSVQKTCVQGGRFVC